MTSLLETKKATCAYFQDPFGDTINNYAHVVVWGPLARHFSKLQKHYARVVVLPCTSRPSKMWIA
jgi:hypothetical protein